MSTEHQKILVVDDEPDILNLLDNLFTHKGFSVTTINNGELALKLLKRDEFGVVLTDLKMPGMSGIELLGMIKEISPITEVIVITGHGTIESAVDAVKKGAYDYISKPINNDYLLLIIDRIFKLRNLRYQNLYLQSQLGILYNFDHIIGKSPQMMELFELIKDVARTHSTILLRGESGTGKELIANAIHYNSLRKDKTMVRVNCAVLSENLLESELFGHVKGAFTGAFRDRIGRFELADSGTIFLDEIGDISPNLQLKLLRVLQEGEFERVGGSKTIKVDVRIIAATNKNLEQALKNGEFREDLYYRLNVIPIELPPLRERIEDIQLLVEHFIDKYNTETGKNIISITPEALELLTSYHWPGNVRELENIIERAVVLTKNNYLHKENLSNLNILDDNKSPLQMLEQSTLPNVIDKIEQELIIKILRRCKGNKSLAARKLGIHRSTFLSKISKYKIKD